MAAHANYWANLNLILTSGDIMPAPLNIIAESDHYVIIRTPIDAYYNQEEKDYTLKHLEALLAKGYRPLHYENRQQGYVCEKPGVRANIAA